MKPRYFFFGLYRVQMWEMMCGMTLAQVELMASDRPLNLYNRKKKDDGGFEKPSAESIDKSRKAWENKHGNGDGSVDAKSIVSNYIKY